jgi:rubrerythrin
MNRTLFAALVALALAGCQSAPKSATDTQATTKSGTEAMTAAAPKEIMELVDQTKVWECPKCGMDFDGPGTCHMDGSTLVETNVSYICPADNKPVEHSGKCPRCATNARVDKVAAAASAPSGQ